LPGIEAKISDLLVLVGSYGWQNARGSFSTSMRLLKSSMGGSELGLLLFQVL